LFGAQSLLEEMERSDDPDILPDVKVYNSVLNGLCRIGNNDSMAKAGALFDRLRQDSGIRPDVVTFQTNFSIGTSCPAVSTQQDLG
jgi:pentatricopeptide repeat protein